MYQMNDENSDNYEFDSKTKYESLVVPEIYPNANRFHLRTRHGNCSIDNKLTENDPLRPRIERSAMYKGNVGIVWKSIRRQGEKVHYVAPINFSYTDTILLYVVLGIYWWISIKKTALSGRIFERMGNVRSDIVLSIDRSFSSLLCRWKFICSGFLCWMFCNGIEYKNWYKDMSSYEIMSSAASFIVILLSCPMYSLSERTG